MSELCPGLSSYKRFKTGTPPRLDRDTIDFKQFIEQPSDKKVQNFHYKSSGRHSKQVSCFLGHTNPETLRIIRENKSSSPMYNGQIGGIGPRYCPSIEDKAFRYPDRDIHHIFLEPEGLQTNSVYPNGISTSLPKEIQKCFIRTIKGLEKAEILQYGHAVEYDVVNTLLLNKSLEHIDTEGLYFAGQVNGTSGYEEAAAQGLVAGLGAACACLNKEAPSLLQRRILYWCYDRRFSNHPKRRALSPFYSEIRK